MPLSSEEIRAELERIRGYVPGEQGVAGADPEALRRIAAESGRAGEVLASGAQASTAGVYHLLGQTAGIAERGFDPRRHPPSRFMRQQGLARPPETIEAAQERVLQPAGVISEGARNVREFYEGLSGDIMQASMENLGEDPSATDIALFTAAGLPLNLLTAIAAAKTVGPVVGFAALGALGVADQDAEVIAAEAAKGATIGALLKYLAPYARPVRGAALGGATYALTPGEEEPFRVAGATTMAALAMLHRGAGTSRGAIARLRESVMRDQRGAVGPGAPPSPGGPPGFSTSAIVRPTSASRALEAGGVMSTRPGVSSPVSTQVEPSQASTTQVGVSEPSRTTLRTLPSDQKGPATTRLGAIDPSTKEMVVQEPGSVEQIFGRARAAQPRLEARLQSVADKAGADLVRRESDAPLGVRLKADAEGNPSPRLLEKAEKSGAESVTDYLGSRFSIERIEDANRVRAAIEAEGGRILEDDNFMLQPSTLRSGEGLYDRGGYRARHLQVEWPEERVSMEIQVVPREIREVQDQAWDLYSRWRRGGTSDEDVAVLMAESRDLYDQAWARFEARQGTGSEEVRAPVPHESRPQIRPPEARAPPEDPYEDYPPIQGIRGERGTVKLPGGDEVPVEYAIVSASDLIPSHDAMTFSPHRNYPARVQERAYHRDKSEQGKVIRNADQWDPEHYIYVRAPDALHGPPVVTPGGVVVAGNSRAASMQRVALGAAKTPASRLGTSARDLAERFGVNPTGVVEIADPVPVRVLTEPVRSMRDLAVLGRRMNEPFTQAVSAGDRGISNARSLSEETLGDLSAAINRLPGDAPTIRQTIRNNPDIVRALERDGIIRPENRNALVDRNGALTREGLETVEDALLGRVLEDADLLNATPPALRNKLLRATPAILQADFEHPDMGLRRIVQQATDKASTRPAGMPLEDYIAQTSLIDPITTSEAAFLRLFERKPTDVQAAFANYARLLRSADTGAQGVLFESPVTPESAFEQAFGTPPAPTYEVIKAVKNRLRRNAQTREAEAADERIERKAVEEEATLRAGGEEPPPPPGEPPRRAPPPPPGGGEPPERPGDTGKEPRYRLDVTRRITQTAGDILASGEVKRDPARRIFDQIGELLATARISDSELDRIIARNGLTNEQFANAWMKDASEHARQLNLLSQVYTRLRGTKQERAKLNREVGYMERWLNIRRGMLVTQLSTAMRNAEVAGMVVTLDGIEQMLGQGMRRAGVGMGLWDPAVLETNQARPFGALFHLFGRDGFKGRTREIVDTVLDVNPLAREMMYRRYSSDVERPGGREYEGMGRAQTALERTTRGGEWLADKANLWNRFQEFAWRRAIFREQLDMRLAARGKSLEQMIERGDVGKIPPDLVIEAANDALVKTFASSFPKDSVPGRVIGLVNKTGFTAVAPFPRFVFNALKYQYEHSPLALKKLTSAAERQKIAEGDLSALAKVMTGSTLFLAAYQFRKSDWAGDPWYMAETPMGPLDLRPFNPFVSYLFWADVMVRWQEDRLNTFSAKDIAMGLASVNLRAGTGLYALDQMIEGVAGIGDAERAKAAAAGFAGEFLSSYLVPFQQVRDVVSAFDESQQVIAERRIDPFGSAFREKFPGVGGRYEAQSPTQAGPMHRPYPLLKQFFGLAFRDPKNVAQKEADRHGLRGGEIVSSTGIPEADYLVREAMGPVFERTVIPFVQSEGYQKARPQTQRELLKEVINEAEQFARAQVAREHPDLWMKVRYLSQGRGRRRMIEGQLGRSPIGP